MRFARRSALSAFFGVTLVFVSAAAFAQPAGGIQDPGIQQRMENQNERIDQGVASGSLTPKETGRLEADQARIQQTKERMKSDGQMTGAERQKLDSMQDRSSRQIYRQKHDAQSVPVRKP